MSLDTVLQIGKVLRQSEKKMKYFKYVEACPKDKDGNYPVCITIPVKEDFSFDWDNVCLTPENERDKLYYLKFKTSDADGLVKYIFGDIYYGREGKLKKDGSIETNEGGYYRLANPNHTNAAFRPCSFNRGKNDYEKVNVPDKSVLKQFHNTLSNNLVFIERVLKYAPAVVNFLENKKDVGFEDFINEEENLYLKTLTINLQVISNANLKKLNIASDISELSNSQKKHLFDLTNITIFIHFKFPMNQYWYHFSDEMTAINQQILDEFVDTNENGLVLKKTLYKTLCSGDKKNDIQFPAFTIKNKHKAKIFDNEILQDLFYAIDYTNKGKLLSGTDIKLIVLPKGEKIAATDYETFAETKDEKRIVKANSNQHDVLFDFSLDEHESITAFDLIFCKKGGLTSPDSDLIEISGIEKSKLRLIMERINGISGEIEKERKKFIKTDKDLFPLKIDYSFRSILGNPQYDEKKKKVSFVANPKYQSHLLKVLPLIYTETYFQDDMLLSAFIQNVEFSIRSGDAKYNFLKYDLKFLLSIQNNNSKNNRYMTITNSKSYQIGLLLGELARNLKSEINSFEKNYVGTLIRRIGNLSDFVKLKNDIEQKLIMHDKTKFTYQTSYELAQKVKEFDARYDKEECAFGFMESYFRPYPPKQNDTVAEKNNTKN
jgi:hypothetical protein